VNLLSTVHAMNNTQRSALESNCTNRNVEKSSINDTQTFIRLSIVIIFKDAVSS